MSEPFGVAAHDGLCPDFDGTGDLQVVFEILAGQRTSATNSLPIDGDDMQGLDAVINPLKGTFTSQLP